MLREKGFYRGVNLGGWFSQCDYSRERLDGFIGEKDFETIASWGLDHVRLPVDYNVAELMDDGIARIKDAVDMAGRFGLGVMIDMHKAPGYSFDAGEHESGFFESADYQKRFLDLWERIAETFGGYGNVAFDLLNEITDEAVLPVWKEISFECMERIRRYAPDVPVVMGSYNYNDAGALKDLDAPYDKNTAYSCHCYDPHDFTHQGAYWEPARDKEKRLAFSESGTDEAFFEEIFRPALLKAEEHGADLYCGEYGVIDVASPEDALEWYRVINKVLERHGISRAAWSYKEMDFGISDARMDGVRDELIRCL